MKRYLGRWMGGIALMLLVSGCGVGERARASVVAPPPEVLQSGALLSALGDALVKGEIVTLPAVVRLVPQRRDQSATQVVGPEGGVVRAGGVVLRIPTGALEAPTAITVVQPAGVFVQGHLAPRGLRFRRPVELGFDVRGTNAAREDLVVTRYDAPLVGGLLPAQEVLEPSFEDGWIAFRTEQIADYAPALRAGAPTRG